MSNKAGVQQLLSSRCSSGFRSFSTIQTRRVQPTRPPIHYLWKTRLHTEKGLKNKLWRMFLILEAGDWMEWTGLMMGAVYDYYQNKGSRVNEQRTLQSTECVVLSVISFSIFEKGIKVLITTQHTQHTTVWMKSIRHDKGRKATQAEDRKEGKKER